MAKLIAPQAMIQKNAKLEYPVRVFAYASIQRGAEIGRYSFINRYSFVNGNVRIGRYCSISRSTDLGVVDHPLDLLSTHPFQYNKAHFEEVPNYMKFDRKVKIFKKRPTNIGHDVWIGAKAIVAAGVNIGTGAVVAANGICKNDVAPYSIVGGTPAKILGRRFENDVVDKLLVSNWWDFHPHELRDVDFTDVDAALSQIEELREKVARTGVTGDGEQSAVEDSSFIAGLRQALTDLMVPEEVAELVLQNSASNEHTFDPLSESDQEILRNKLTYLAEFLQERNVNECTQSELKHIAQIFRSKH